MLETSPSFRCFLNNYDSSTYLRRIEDTATTAIRTLVFVIRQVISNTAAIRAGSGRHCNPPSFTRHFLLNLRPQLGQAYPPEGAYSRTDSSSISVPQRGHFISVLPPFINHLPRKCDHIGCRHTSSAYRHWSKVDEPKIHRYDRYGSFKKLLSF